VLKDESALRHARQVSMTLATIASAGPTCPRAADRFDWSSDVLDEIARAVSTVGDVVEAVTAAPDDEIARLAAELATAIVRRRNELLRDGSARRTVVPHEWSATPALRRRAPSGP
jgi:hypothetical protein